MKTDWQHHHKFFQAIAAFFAPLVLVGTGLTLLQPYTTRADDFSPFVPYGGWIVSYVPPTAPPAPPCPGYTLIRNADVESTTPFFGVYIPPFSDMLLYDNRILGIPNTAKAGGYEPVPFATCPALYPVFPIFFDGLFFLDGSGAGPDI